MDHETVKEQVMSFLFDQDGITLRNVKLFVGDQPAISEAELLRELHSAFVQERSGTAKVTRVFQDDRPTVDVERFLACL